MASRSEKMYKNSPKLERNSESGKVGVTKNAMESAKTADGTKGIEENGDESGMPVDARHAQERRDMHNRHETEHSVHGKGDKKAMHERHAIEMKATHKRHEKEMSGGEKSGAVGKKTIDKIENDNEGEA